MVGSVEVEAIRRASAIVTTLVDVTSRLRAVAEVFRAHSGTTYPEFPSIQMGIGHVEGSALAEANLGVDVSLDWAAEADFLAGLATVSVLLSLSWQSERGSGGEWYVDSAIRYRTHSMDDFEDAVVFPDFYCADSMVAVTVLKERLQALAARLPDCIERALDDVQPAARVEVPPDEWDATSGTPQDAKSFQMIVATSFLLEAAVSDFVVKKTTVYDAARPCVVLDRGPTDADDAVGPPSVRWVLTGNVGQSADVDIELALVALEDRFRGRLMVRHLAANYEWICESQSSVELTTVSGMGLWLEEMVDIIRERLRRRPPAD